MHNLPNVVPVVIWHGALHCMKLDVCAARRTAVVSLAVASRLAGRLALCLHIVNLSGQKGRRTFLQSPTLSFDSGRCCRVHCGTVSPCPLDRLNKMTTTESLHFAWVIDAFAPSLISNYTAELAENVARRVPNVICVRPQIASAVGGGVLGRLVGISVVAAS